jgi:hypothetical protein
MCIIEQCPAEHNDCRIFMLEYIRKSDDVVSDDGTYTGRCQTYKQMQQELVCGCVWT